MTVADEVRPPPESGWRAVVSRAPMSPAQIGSLVIGTWWTINGIGAFLLDPNFATGHVHGAGDLFGLAITVNGWHALFHLLPGLVGIAVASRRSAALAYTLGIGATYAVVGAWGLLAGGSSVSVLAVDATGDLVHIVEGLIAFTTGLLTVARGRRGRRQWPAAHT